MYAPGRAMARRPPDLTPSDSGTPTDSVSARHTDTPPAPLPRPPAIPSRGLPARGAPARPGRRGETPSDNLMTARIERVRDATPAPLPPSPGARDAERWFEQVPTNPALDDAAPGERTGSHRRTRTSQRLIPAGAATALAERPWVIPSLIAAVALTIGMILGALLFGDRAASCPPPATHDPAPAPPLP